MRSHNIWVDVDTVPNYKTSKSHGARDEVRHCFSVGSSSTYSKKVFETRCRKLQTNLEDVVKFQFDIFAPDADFWQNVATQYFNNKTKLFISHSDYIFMVNQYERSR